MTLYSAASVAEAATPAVQAGSSFLGRALTPLSDHNTATNVGEQVSDGTNTVSNSRMRYKTLRAAEAIAVAFTNWTYWGTTTPAPNNITVSAAIEYSGKIVPLYFNGRRDVVIEPDTPPVMSDPSGLMVPAGAALYVRTRVTVSGGEVYYKTRLTDGANFTEGSLEAVDTTDLTTSGSITANYAWAYGPFGVFATLQDGERAAIAGIGDSVMKGYGDLLGPGQSNTTYDWGFLRRAFTDLNPVINLGFTADTAQGFASIAATNSEPAPRALPFRSMLAAQCRFAFLAHGTNDFYGRDRTTAQVQADNLAIAARMVTLGLTCFICTVTPRTTSTDSWATVGNQTIAQTTQNAARIVYNNWVRAGCPIDPTTKAAVAVGTSGALLTGSTGHPIEAWFEVADSCESARDSGKWPAGGTTDGLHPNQTLHAAMGAGITTDLFA